MLTPLPSHCPSTLSLTPPYTFTYHSAPSYQHIHSQIHQRLTTPSTPTYSYTTKRNNNTTIPSHYPPIHSHSHHHTHSLPHLLAHLHHTYTLYTPYTRSLTPYIHTLYPIYSLTYTTIHTLYPIYSLTYTIHRHSHQCPTDSIPIFPSNL